MGALNAALQPLVDGIRLQPGVALTIFLIWSVLSLALTVLALRFGLRAARTQARLLRGTDGASLERMLLEYADDVVLARERMERTQRRGDETAAAVTRTLQRIGLVRYDALRDLGGQRSFSLAMLDDRGSGVVLTGLYARHETHVYAKPVVAGRSSIMLTDEEKKAIASAVPPSEMPQEIA